MPHVPQDPGEPGAHRLPRAELARLTSSTPARISQLVEIGVLRPGPDGRFAPGDIQRVQAVAAYERGGIELEQIAVAVRERRITFDYADRIYPAASPASGRTVADLATELGPRADLLPDLFIALGLPRPTPERGLTEADEQVLQAFFDAWGDQSIPSDAGLRAARLVGDAARRTAGGWVDLFMETIAPPTDVRVGMSVEELAPRLFEPATRISQLLEPMMIWLLRRHLEQALNTVNVETMERALEIEGARPAVARQPPAVVFADMSGFTRLTEEHGDELAARHAATLARLADRAAATHDGRLVKQLGDGVMLTFDAAGPAVAAAKELRSAAADSRLPPLHVGITAGPVIERDGDVFGRTVNLASRLSGLAGPGEILLDEIAAGADHGVLAHPLAPAQVKGLAAPIPVFRLDEDASD